MSVLEEVILLSSHRVLELQSGHSYIEYCPMIDLRNLGKLWNKYKFELGLGNQLETFTFNQPVTIYRFLLSTRAIYDKLRD